MKEMFKSKAIIGFLIIAIGIGYMGGHDNISKMDVEEINHIVVVEK